MPKELRIQRQKRLRAKVRSLIVCFNLIFFGSMASLAQSKVIAEGSYRYFSNGKPTNQLDTWRMRRLPNNGLEVEIATRDQASKSTVALHWSEPNAVKQTIRFSKEQRWFYYELRIPSAVNPYIDRLTCDLAETHISCSMVTDGKRAAGKRILNKPAFLDIKEFHGRDLPWFLVAAANMTATAQPGFEAVFDLILVDTDDDEKPRRVTLTPDDNDHLRVKYLGEEDIQFMGHTVSTRKFIFRRYPTVTAWFTKSGFLLQTQDEGSGYIALSDLKQTESLIPELK